MSSLGNDVAQKWKYNGVEFDEITGLYEMDFRQYDAAIGRFTRIDPLVEVIPSINPYNFGLNNPVLFSDKTGLLPHYNWNDGTYRDDNNNVISFEAALAAYGVGSSSTNQTDPTDPLMLPSDPSKIDSNVWGDGSFTPDGVPEGKGHAKYWNHKDGNVILAYDDDGHYHLYKNNGGRLGKRLQANGELAGYVKNGKFIYRKGAPNAHIQPGQGEQNRAYLDFKTNQVYEWSTMEDSNIREVRIYEDYKYRSGEWRGVNLILKQYFDPDGNPVNMN